MRNWDYRFCWIRDATLTFYALFSSGYHHEARAWREWLLRAAAGHPSEMQIMYGLAGERRLAECELDGCPGYADSRPVRIGNAALRQLQLDVYGELIDALHAAAATGSKAALRLGAAEKAARISGKDLGRAGSRHVGGARPAAAFHLLEDDVLGRLRPRDQIGRAVRAGGPLRALAQDPRHDLCRDPRQGL